MRRPAAILFARPSKAAPRAGRPPSYSPGLRRQRRAPAAVNVPLDRLLTDEGQRARPTDGTPLVVSADGTPLVVVSADGRGAGLAAGLLGAMGDNAHVPRFGPISWSNSTDVKVQRTDRTRRIQGLNGPRERGAPSFAPIWAALDLGRPPARREHNARLTY